MKLNLNQKGSTVALAVSVALAAAILIAAASRSLLFSSHQVVYFNAMNRAYRLAETGLVEATGRLAVDPGFYISSPTLVTDVSVPGEGTYSVVIATRTDIIASGYYFITTATATVGGRTYCTRLHTHLRISNAADYFWACNQTLSLAQGTDASGGKVYAPILDFQMDGAKPVTKVSKAEYMTAITPAIGTAGVYGAPASGSRVEVSVPNPANGQFQPAQVTAVVFPQVDDGDMAYYLKLATNGATTYTGCNFVSANPQPWLAANYLNVYPPGYVGADYGSNPDPHFAQKGPTNKYHYWYCPGDLHIGNVRVIGQVLFAVKGDVYIDGNIMSDSNPIGNTYYPGAGADPVVNRSSSTAHQAVIVTQKNVWISNQYYSNAVPANTHLIELVEAMILGPHGKLSGVTYGTTPPNYTSPIHNLLALKIVGSLISGQVENNAPNNFGSIFLDNTLQNPPRIYNYMASLKTSPMEAMPAITEVYFSYEQNMGQGNIFN